MAGHPGWLHGLPALFGIAQSHPSTAWPDAMHQLPLLVDSLDAEIWPTIWPTHPAW
jgi:hypothetical protein